MKMPTNAFTCITVLCTLHVSANGDQVIAAGKSHSMVVRTDGTVWGTGHNEYGALGDGTNKLRKTFVQATGISGVTSISAGEYHSVVVKSDGTAWGTGMNTNGQLGDGTNDDRNTFVQAKNMVSDVRAVAAGRFHTMVLKTDGTVWGVGRNGLGALGDGTNNHRNTFVQVISGGVQAIAAGYRHSVVLKTDGTVWTTGWNGYGALGDGTNEKRNTFVQVASDVRAIAAGRYHTMVVKSDGSVWSVGRNDFGKFGDGTTDTMRNTFVQVISGGVRAIAAGRKHTMVVKSDGTVWGAGYNVYGQLGDGTRKPDEITDRQTFVQAKDMSDVKALVAGMDHNLVVKSDGTVWSTGLNAHGQLGINTKEDSDTFVKMEFATRRRSLRGGLLEE